MIKQAFILIRRYLLKIFVPEFVWPKIVFLDKIPIHVRNMNYSFGVKKILSNGTYEFAERYLLSCIKIEGFNIIEIGCSIGILTQILAFRVGEYGRVIAVEADFKLAAQTKRDLAHLHNVQIISGYGFPVKSIRDRINIEKFENSKGSLGGTVEFALDKPNMGKQNNNKNIFDLEKICREYDITPQMLVIDIEGSENVILECDDPFPETVKYILIELHPDLYYNTTEDKIVNSITNNGFSILNKKDNSYIFSKTILI